MYFKMFQSISGRFKGFRGIFMSFREFRRLSGELQRGCFKKFEMSHGEGFSRVSRRLKHFTGFQVFFRAFKGFAWL